LIAGDCVHNLRSALDHLVYAIAIDQSPTGKLADERAIAFPIKDASKDFNSVRRRLKELSLPVQAAIEAVQPYNRAHATLPPLLAVLRDLDDADKHRLLQLAVSKLSQWKFVNVRGLAPDQAKTIVFHVGDVEDGTEIAAIALDRPTPDVSYQYEGVLVIALCNAIGPPEVSRTEISALLHALDAEVREVVRLVLAAQ
jgi:hypothetical protein